ncbi:hypothetical protein [Ekhidna sp.]
MSTKKVIITVLVWGLITGSIHTAFMRLILDKNFSSTSIWVICLIWMIAGLLFGFTMKWWINKRKKVN